jgi:hypothetical protein
MVSTSRLLVAVTSCVALGLGACVSDKVVDSESSATTAGSQEQETTTTAVPEDPSCRQAAEFTVATIADTARESAAGIESFATEDDLGAVILGFLTSLPEEIDVDAETACGDSDRAISELRRALENTIKEEPQPVADLTLAFFAIGCSEDLPAEPGDDPAEREAYRNELCPTIEGYFNDRGFSLESGSGEPGFR